MDNLEDDTRPSSFFKTRTRRWKTDAIDAGDLAYRVRAVLDFMESKNIDLPILLWAISWNNAELIADARVRFHRTTLMVSDELPDILSKWANPPRVHGRGLRTQAGKEAIQTLAFQLVSQVIEKEVENMVECMRRSPDDVSEDSLLTTNWEVMIREAKEAAPFLWNTLRMVSYMQRQDTRNTMKTPDFVSVLIIFKYSRINLFHRQSSPLCPSYASLAHIMLAGSSSFTLSILRVAAWLERVLTPFMPLESRWDPRPHMR